MHFTTAESRECIVEDFFRKVTIHQNGVCHAGGFALEPIYGQSVQALKILFGVINAEQLVRKVTVEYAFDFLETEENTRQADLIDDGQIEFVRLIEIQQPESGQKYFEISEKCVETSAQYVSRYAVAFNYDVEAFCVFETVRFIVLIG